MKMTMVVHVNGRTYTSPESVDMTEKERDGAIDELYKSIETLVKLRMDTENGVVVFAPEAVKNCVIEFVDTKETL